MLFGNCRSIKRLLIKETKMKTICLVKSIIVMNLYGCVLTYEFTDPNRTNL